MSSSVRVATGRRPAATLIAHCEVGLARFKVPRYIATRSASGALRKIAKHLLADGVSDLHAASYDRVEARWR
jgi:hypothetical protein